MKVSVVIPTLNEAPQIHALVEATRLAGAFEVIVADGGSDDETVANAASADRVVQCERGRGPQQNAGAAVCSGDAILFLHADCRVESASFEAITTAFEDDRVIAGCLKQKVENADWRLRIVERGNHLRAKLLGWAYGDQGIFVRTDVFRELGGFPNVKLMEDLMLAKQLRKRGKFVVLSAPITTSPRRWNQRGIVRQTLRNWTFLVLAHCGVSPNWLAKFYPNVR